ncbi:hypothetical protein NFI96_022120 [Prochilodus magdalenae]|nr:hypothetical protein NFI96_022120 [Prochilodus magdalenae]
MSPSLQLSIYNPEPPVARYVEEQPGRLQTGLGRMRVGLQPYVRTVQVPKHIQQTPMSSMFLKGGLHFSQSGNRIFIPSWPRNVSKTRRTKIFEDSPPDCAIQPPWRYSDEGLELQRVWSGVTKTLTGLLSYRHVFQFSILEPKVQSQQRHVIGSRIKRIGVPLALTSVGTAVCYPTQTVGVLKFAGMKVYSGSSVVALVFKSKPKEDLVVAPASLEPVTPNFDPEVEAAIGEGSTSDTPSTTPEIIPTPTWSVAPSAPETQLPAVTDVAESRVFCLPETDPPPDIAPVSSEIAPVPEVASEATPETFTHLPEAEPTANPIVTELGPTAGVTSPSDVTPEDAPVLQLAPTVDVAPIKPVPLVPGFALEEVNPVEVRSEVASEMMEDVTLPALAPEDATSADEVMPMGDASPVEVVSLPDVTPDRVTPMCEAELVEDALVAHVTPEALATEDGARPDLAPVEVVPVSEMGAALELDLTAQPSSIVEVTLLPDVAPEQATPTEASLAGSTVESSAAALPESVAPLPDKTLEAEASPLSSQLESKPEATHGSTRAAESGLGFEVEAETVTEAAFISKLVPTEKEAPPLIPLSSEEPPPSTLTAPLPSPTPLEGTVPLPPTVEDTNLSAPLVEEDRPGPPATDEITSIPDVTDEAILALAVELETTSSSPADEATPPTHAEHEIISRLSATQDGRLPPQAAVEETKPLTKVEEDPGLMSPVVEEKPRFAPDPSLLDHGQAHPEDADMYSTRG